MPIIDKAISGEQLLVKITDRVEKNLFICYSKANLHH
jgi:hypothetical protein